MNSKNTNNGKSNLLYLPGNCGSSSVAEHQLPKLRVAGSTPVSRSKIIRESDENLAPFVFLVET